ncbi:putative uncharacterized protein [Coprobacillus sp. CAG:826]|jgi:putative membrane protein (TIGR04086 family)|nr:putative uncharacterized protein [Coprobacillus sp. CAG:826]
MKKTIATISMSFFALLFFGLIFSLILSLLSYKDVITVQSGEWIMYISSLIGFFALGFYSGFKTKKRGLLIGITLSLIYVLFALILRFFGLTSTGLLSRLMLIARIVILNVSAVLGVNMGSKRLEKH